MTNTTTKPALEKTPATRSWELVRRNWSLFLAVVLLLGLLVYGVPLFLRTPVWVDVTYHDLSARNVLSGGVHYREIFETNLPGMVWLHCLVRSVCGWSHEAIRVVDLLVVGSVVWFLVRLLRGEKISLVKQVWFAVACTLFYLFETEFIHCQRDVWMLLPSMVAVTLRWRRLQKVGPSGWRRRVLALAEGLAWGCAVWIKPHVLAAAFGVWLGTLRGFTWRGCLADTLAVVLGGILAGLAGTTWLLVSGTWSPMWEVLLNWNGEYYRWSWTMFWYKIRVVPSYFLPFSALHYVALPLALYSLVRRSVFGVRSLLAGFYLGWLAQATLVQKTFDYAQAPPLLLGLAFLASWRWPVGRFFFLWLLLAGAVEARFGETTSMQQFKQQYKVVYGRVFPNHALFEQKRFWLWDDCWHDDSWELKDQLSHFEQTGSNPDWADLHKVADFLRTQQVGDGELICWHDTTHPLYLDLQIKPGYRFPHVMTAMRFQSKHDILKREAFENQARFVVSDLIPVTYTQAFSPAPPAGPCAELPPEFPAWKNTVYPWNQPVVFRAGRYFVHRLTNPQGEIVFPLPFSLYNE